MQSTSKEITTLSAFKEILGAGHLVMAKSPQLVPQSIADWLTQLL